MASFRYNLAMIKRLLLIFSIILLAVLIVFGEVGYKIKTFKASSLEIRPDVILVLGCDVQGTEPGPFLRARLDEAIKIYEGGGVNFILVSGGQGKREKIAEADAMKNYLIQNNIPADKIIAENQSKDTIQNIRNSKLILESFNFERNPLIISNDYHLRRINFIALENDFYPDLRGVSTSNYPLQEIVFFGREILASVYHGYF